LSNSIYFDWNSLCKVPNFYNEKTTNLWDDFRKSDAARRAD